MIKWKRCFYDLGYVSNPERFHIKNKSGDWWLLHDIHGGRKCHCRTFGDAKKLAALWLQEEERACIQAIPQTSLETLELLKSLIQEK